MIAFGFARNLLIISTATLASNLSAATRKKLSTILESWENAKTIFNAGYLFGGCKGWCPDWPTVDRRAKSEWQMILTLAFSLANTLPSKLANSEQWATNCPALLWRNLSLCVCVISSDARMPDWAAQKGRTHWWIYSTAAMT